MNSTTKKLFGFLLLFVLVAGDGQRAAGATLVSGPISTDTTWTLAGSPYRLTGNVTISAGVTLTVDPGVTVDLGSDVKDIDVNGTLTGDGATFIGGWCSGWGGNSEIRVRSGGVFNLTNGTLSGAGAED